MARFDGEKFLDQPWNRLLVLSLDGGGIRGASSLLILERLMQRVAELDPEHCQDRDESGELRPALPCHYFDLMVGTSTGGLIAIMLGRLRMSIEECKAEYFRFGDRIFAKPKVAHMVRRSKYDERNLEKAIKEVVKAHAGGEQEPLRQPDCTERLPRSCMSAVLSVTEGEENVKDITYFFRSYNQEWREDRELGLTDWRNKGQAYDGPIWRACRATTAAPTYFKKMRIGPRWHMDGGVMNNNPSLEAWLEAHRIISTDVPRVGLLLSVGTGRSREASRFEKSKFWPSRMLGDRLAMLKVMRSRLTNVDEVHERMQEKAGPAQYSRLTVLEGLEDVMLDEWKVKKLSPGQTNTGQAQRNAQSGTGERLSDPPPAQRDASNTAHAKAGEGAASATAHQVSSQSSSGRSGKRERKFKYVTRDTILDATNRFLNDNPAVDEQVNQIAARLVAFARARREGEENLTRWNSHVGRRAARQGAHQRDLQPLRYRTPSPSRDRGTTGIRRSANVGALLNVFQRRSTV